MTARSKPVFKEVDLDAIEMGYNVRTSVWWPAEDSAALVEDVRQRGVLEPILLAERKGGKKFEIVCGHRRYSAACGADLKTIPAIVYRNLPDATVVEMQLSENLQRRDLNAIEVARGLGKLRDLTGEGERELAARFGRVHEWAGNYLSLLRLPNEMQERVALGRIVASVAFKFAARLPKDAEKVARIADRLEGKSVREADSVLVEEGILSRPLEKFAGNDGSGADASGQTFSHGGRGAQCDCSCDCCQVPGHTKVELGLSIAAVARP
jgi:ParB/RepB/Spo0J family partition protein